MFVLSQAVPSTQSMSLQNFIFFKAGILIIYRLLSCNPINARLKLKSEKQSKLFMAKEYKTMVFYDTVIGRKAMAAEIDKLANDGWEIKSKEVSDQGWSADKTCCLGGLFSSACAFREKRQDYYANYGTRKSKPKTGIRK